MVGPLVRSSLRMVGTPEINPGAAGAPDGNLPLSPRPGQERAVTVAGGTVVRLAT
jgi:hypothetical protein